MNKRKVIVIIINYIIALCIVSACICQLISNRLYSNKKRQIRLLKRSILKIERNDISNEIFLPRKYMIPNIVGIYRRGMVCNFWGILYTTPPLLSQTEE